MTSPVLALVAATINLRAVPTMRQAKVVADVDKAADLGASVIFWEEAGWQDRYKEAIADRMPFGDPAIPKGWNHRWFPGNSTGISFDRSIWQALSGAKKFLLHAAVPGVSDDRWMVLQALRHRATKQTVWFLAFHHAPKRAGLGLRAQRRGNDTLRYLIEGALKRGVPVVAGGDANQAGQFLGTEIAGCKVTYRSGEKGGGIDKLIYVAPTGFSWTVTKPTIIGGVNSDHAPVRASAVLHRVKPTPATGASPIDRILAIAKAEVGYREGRSNGHWNNEQKYSPAVPSLEWSQNQAWCATFVSWCAMKAGLSELYPRTASTDTAARWWKARNQWHDYPAVGAQILFGVNGDMNHTGLVYDWDDTYVYTIEGNTNESGSREGDGVYLKKHARRLDRIQGYGYPAVRGGLRSADPNYRKGSAA